MKLFRKFADASLKAENAELESRLRQCRKDYVKLSEQIRKVGGALYDLVESKLDEKEDGYTIIELVDIAKHYYNVYKSGAIASEMLTDRLVELTDKAPESGNPVLALQNELKPYCTVKGGKVSITVLKPLSFENRSRTPKRYARKSDR